MQHKAIRCESTPVPPSTYTTRTVERSASSQLHEGSLIPPWARLGKGAWLEGLVQAIYVESASDIGKNEILPGRSNVSALR